MEGSPRPKQAERLPDNFDRVLKDMRDQKENSPALFAGTVADLSNMAEGESAYGVRNQYYLGWTDANFKKLLEELGGK